MFFLKCRSQAYEIASYGYHVTNEIVQELMRNEIIERNGLEYIKLTQRVWIGVMKSVIGYYI